MSNAIEAPEIGEQVFNAACREGDLRAYLNRCSDDNLRELLAWLARQGEINDVPGEVWRHAAVVAVRRFQEQGGAR